MKYISSSINALKDMLDENAFYLFKGGVALFVSVLIGFTQFYTPHLKSEYDQLKLEYEIQAELEKYPPAQPFNKIDCFKIEKKNLEVKCRLAQEIKFNNGVSTDLFKNYIAKALYFSYFLFVFSFMGFMVKLNIRTNEKYKKKTMKNE
jgi:hypothetical protein